LAEHFPTGARHLPEHQGDLQGFNPRIESLRGIAAMMVAAFHVGQTGYRLEGGGDGQRQLIFVGEEASAFWNALRIGYSWLLNGHGAVVLFFVISGFVLSRSLDRMSGPAGRIACLFLLRRALRLWPPVVFMVAAFAFFHFTANLRLPNLGADAYQPLQLLRHALLHGSHINGVVWTLQVEAFAAPVILMGWMAARRRGSRVLWMLAVVLCVASFARGFDRWVADIGLPRAGYLQFLYVFIAGMLIPDWAAYIRSLGLHRRVAALYPVSGMVLILAAPYIFGLGSNYRSICEMAGSVALVTGVVLGMTSLVGRVLDRPLVRFYGRISYSFYLLHPLTLTVLWNQPELVGQIVSLGVPKVVVALLLLAVSVAVVTPLAMLSYALVEAPSIRLGRRLGSARPAPQLSLEAIGP
jgi:peptidoglycan/LPS O-acetylase OafA/YrhL